jgi:mono/diheme cytochrome c family protein
MVLKSIFIIFLATSIFVVSCSESTDETGSAQQQETVREPKTLYVLHCEACHGLDGAKGVSNAANLQKSKITKEEIEAVILNGNDKGMMPYKSIITAEKEIKGLVDYVQNLRK